MLLTLVQEKKIENLTLPERVSGRYTLGGVTVEGVNRRWIVKATRKVRFRVRDASITSMVLEEGQVYPLTDTATGQELLLFAKAVTDDSRTYHKFIVPENGTVTIGREADNDICYPIPFVTGHHAVLQITNRRMRLVDKQSTNGTYINGERVREKDLAPGDVVCIKDLKLLVGRGFLAMNDPDGAIHRSKKLRPMLPQTVPPLPADEEEGEEQEEDEALFFRSPRFKRDIEPAKFTIDPPPVAPGEEATPLMLLLGPSMTMGLVSLSTGIFTVYNAMNAGGNMLSVMPSLVMSIGMMLGTVLWPVLTKRFEKKNRIRKEKERLAKYRDYLQSIRQAIDAEAQRQKAILEENIVPIADCTDRIFHERRNLWERTYRHNDFLLLRLGVGDLPMEAEFHYPEHKFTLKDDPLEKELYTVCEGEHRLQDVPISISLRENYVMGIIGERAETTAAVRGLITQIAALHSYDEVKMVFLYSEKEAADWEFIRWLPHTWDDGKNIHFIADNAGDARELSAFLERELSARRSQQQETDHLPWYVVFALDRDLARKTELLHVLLEEKKCLGFSLIALYDELKFLPKECSKVAEFYRGTGFLYDQDDIHGERLAFVPDIGVSTDCREMAVRLGNTFLNTASSKKELPDLITFLQMFKVGKVEHLNSLTRWQEHNPTRTLATEIAADENGSIMSLDLHQNFHGPHGLMAGMTGSGKSEVIMTYILSLAVNYHPNEVAFILIDYKGGTMAKAFEKLPHTVGIITNLDGAQVKRSLVSIESELHRREIIFQKVSKQINVSNIDIYKYQQLYREGKVKEPLPHLFIISDEFAELKHQQEEFMKALVSASRIGRSLGVHLILATQKPNGVVDEEIRSNSRFQLCLKVQSKNDSMDMLNRPDAAELVKTGRFYLQVGYNEIFALGQSAWAGAPYTPSDYPETDQDSRTVSLLDGVGHVVRQAAIQKKRTGSQKQLDAVVDYLAQLAKDEGIVTKPMWMPPLEKVIVYEELLKKYGITPERTRLAPVIGELDDPENQRQLPLTLPLTEKGNAIIYGVTGGGKTTLVTTMLYGLLKTFTARQLHLYLADFGSETLTVFAKAPQVGDVVLSHEEEKMQNLLRMLTDELGRRKKLCAGYGGDLAAYQSSSGKTLPYILTVIQNFAAFTETYDEMETQVALLAREGSKYGIYFVVTAPGTNAVRLRTQQNFGQMLVLQMNDPSDYSAVFGATGGMVPGKCKGRGLVKTDGLYEFQTASVDRDNATEKVRTYCEILARTAIGPRAPRIPVMPERVTPDFVENEIDVAGLRFPVGVEKASMKIAHLPLKERPIHYIMSRQSVPAYTAALLQVLIRRPGLQVDLLDGTLAAARLSGGEEAPLPPAMAAPQEVKAAATREDLNKLTEELFWEILSRHNNAVDCQTEGKPAPVYPVRVTLIQNPGAVFEWLTPDIKNKMENILAFSKVSLNMFFILAETDVETSKYSFKPWFKQLEPLNNGLWLGDGITDQFRMRVDYDPSAKLYQEIGGEYGYLVKDGVPTLMKLLTDGEGEH